MYEVAKQSAVIVWVWKFGGSPYERLITMVSIQTVKSIQLFLADCVGYFLFMINNEIWLQYESL